MVRQPIIVEVFKMPERRCLYGLLALLLASSELFAKGSIYRMEDRYNP